MLFRARNSRKESFPEALSTVLEVAFPAELATAPPAWHNGSKVTTNTTMITMVQIPMPQPGGVVCAEVLVPPYPP